MREANIGFSAFCAILKAMDMDEPYIELSSKIPDDVANFILNLRNEDLDFIKLIEKAYKEIEE